MLDEFVSLSNFDLLIFVRNPSIAYLNYNYLLTQNHSFPIMIINYYHFPIMIVGSLQKL